MKRNQQRDGTYSSVHAEASYRTRRKGCHPQSLLANQALHDRVQRLILDHQWSPEQIDQRMKQEHSLWKISYITIYRGIKRNLLDIPDRQPGQRGLARHLRHHGKSRHGKGYEERRGKIDFHPALDQRP
ncbi:hypothetical protein ABNN70_06145 [Sporolactobacillus sp. Y61]|uniref:Transposase n=1 Tax=Sporolactobacillus sp. Y61 TaxID=3160863 RepID=A0AAU8IKN4_9BACL